MTETGTPLLPLLTTQDLRDAPFALAAFTSVALGEGLVRMRRVAFPAADIRLDQLEALGDVLVSERSSHGLSALVRLDRETIVHVGMVRGQGDLAVAGRDGAAVERIVADLVATFGERPVSDEERVPITFWAHAPGGPMSPRRRIDAPAWEEIRANYAAATRERLDALLDVEEPGPGGLLLWHGEPGTGKSTAIRALARAWRRWCDVHFIADPDAFLGRDSHYLLGALLRRAPADRWRLLVLEDAGELLAADARAVAGQAVSRLLNLTDGLLGAGLRTLVLVTTNEPVGRLHPAIARPGRTWAEVEFPPLSAEEANGWLAGRGVAERVSAPAPLAELFAIADERPVARRGRMGFS